MGRFKKGTDTGFIDVCTNPIFIGDVVENTINGTKGEVTTYGVVADAEGGKHKLSNQIWKVVIPYGKSEETVKEHTESLKKEAKELLAREKRKAEPTIITLTDNELVELVYGRGADLWGAILNRIPEHYLTYAVRERLSDYQVADELRARGYEVTATKTISL